MNKNTKTAASASMIVRPAVLARPAKTRSPRRDSGLSVVSAAGGVSVPVGWAVTGLLGAPQVQRCGGQVPGRRTPWVVPASGRRDLVDDPGGFLLQGRVE